MRDDRDDRTGETDGSGTGGSNGSARAVSRRGVLRTTSGAVLGAAALGVGSGAVGAATDGTAERAIKEVDFRDGVPPVGDGPQGADEVVFNVHGYSASSYSVREARRFQRTAREVGYEGTVAAVTWDDSGGVWGAIGNARDTGGSLAGWLADYKAANPDTTVRLLGHSMGGIVTVETVAAIDGAFEIANADMIGSYEQRSAPCRGSGYYDAIEASVGGMFNYRSDNDGIARLGSGGARCSASETPSNYRDVDVTDSVGGHSEYKSSEGCVRRILENHVDDGGDDPGIAVSTGGVEEVTAGSATATGELTTLGDADAATVRFEYRETGDRSWSRTKGRQLSSPGAFEAELTGLAPGTEYAVRAAAEATDGDADVGDAVTFTTESAGGDAPPTVEGLDYTRSCFWSCDLAVEWSVADPDGDLATVELALFGQDGGRIDAASADVSGSSASGTDELSYYWFQDPARVEVTVVDEAGNTGSDRIG